MAKRPAIKHPITGFEIIDMNLLEIHVPNNQTDALYPDDVDFSGYGVATDIFFRDDYLMKVKMKLTCALERQYDEESGVQKHDTENTTEELVSTASAEFIFKLISKSKKEDFETGMLPEEMRQAAVSVSYSTFRGMIYTRAAGTLLESFILPITDANAILTPRKDDTEKSNETEAVKTE